MMSGRRHNKECRRSHTGFKLTCFFSFYLQYICMCVVTHTISITVVTGEGFGLGKISSVTTQSAVVVVVLVGGRMQSARYSLINAVWRVSDREADDWS